MNGMDWNYLKNLSNFKVSSLGQVENQKEDLPCRARVKLTFYGNMHGLTFQIIRRNVHLQEIVWTDPKMKHMAQRKLINNSKKN